MHCQQAPSATPGLVAKLVGAGKCDPEASKSFRTLPVILVTEQDCFYRWSEIKAPRPATGVEAEFFFCWSDTESSGGLLLWLFFSCNGLTGVLSLQYHTPCKAQVWQQMFSGAAARSTLQHPSHSSNEIKQQLASQGGGAGVAVGQSTLSLTLPNLPSHCHTTDGITKAAVSTELSSHVHAAKTCMPRAGEDYTTPCNRGENCY